jgi:type II secretory pathway component PulK
MSRRRHERGVALLLVLWVFMVLGVIALDFARYMRDDAMAAINFADEARGYYIALAGMNRALFDVERLREVTAATARAPAAGSAPMSGWRRTHPSSRRTGSGTRASSPAAAGRCA